MVKVFCMVKVFRHHYPKPFIFGFNIENAAAGP